MTKSNALTVRNSASPAEVRTFLREQGVEVGTRGKFSAEQIHLFNKSHAVKYVQAKHVPTRAFQVKDKRNFTVTRKMNVAQAREVLVANGVPVGTRGRLSADHAKRAYALASSAL